MFYEGQLLAWGLTLVSEGIIAALIARDFGLTRWKAAAAAIVGSLITHPIVWWAYHEQLATWGYWEAFAALEAFAVLAEAPFYRLAGAPWARAVALSFIVNAASVLVGFAYQAAM